MKAILESLSIVIVAKDLNVSIFKPFWLMKNNIFHEQELQGNIVITPPAVQIPTQNFQFMVLPDRLQMLMPRQYPDAEADIARVVGGIVKTLPHTPYTAVGLNFNYFIAPESEDAFGAWNRNLFASPVASRLQLPEDKNARFGSYVSFDVLGMRLKIDIKPIKVAANIESLCKSWHTGQDLILLNFNFHSDVVSSESPADSIIDKLDKWSESLVFSQKLIAMFSE